uniref:Uncharacterized protein n=1 Tax=Phaeodactylum tricornutum TaxID=2850 RepID=A0A8J9X565_PHATR
MEVGKLPLTPIG